MRIDIFLSVRYAKESIIIAKEIIILPSNSHHSPKSVCLFDRKNEINSSVKSAYVLFNFLNFSILCVETLIEFNSVIIYKLKELNKKVNDTHVCV